MDAESQARLRRNLDAATYDALVALANRGLVRRAAKDLEQGGRLEVEEVDDALLVVGVGWTVLMPAEGPTAATDDTSATGVTRQIIAATIFLRDHWSADELAETPETATPVIAEQSDDAIKAAAERLIEAPSGELFKWSGKTPLLEAAAATRTIGPAKIVYSPQLTVEFSDPEVRVVLMTDRPAKTLRRLLDQFKTTTNKREHARWVMAAVLALKQAAGKSTSVENDPGGEITEAIREDRQRIAHYAQSLLAAVAASGIAHPSSRIVERFRTAGVAAEAAYFPRLARLLASIADDAQLQIARDAAADPARMMQRMVVAHALSDATARSENANRIDLFGRARTSYAAAGNLELSGLGAYGWQTASGFEGLSIIFWDAQGKRFLTASTSRGAGQDRTFSIRQAYHSGIGWSGGAAVETMCRSRLKLSDAKTNPEGRLSLSETCRVVLGEPIDPNTADFGDVAISNWIDLANIAQRSQPIGLRLPDTRAPYVVIKPARWGDRWFDELEQEFVWQLYDESEAALQVRVPWSEIDEPSVAFLESIKLDRDKPSALLGRLEVRRMGLQIYPFSVFSNGTSRGDKVLCPQFDQDRIRSRNEALLKRLRKKFKRQPRVETRIGDAESDDVTDSDINNLADLPPLIRSLLFDVDHILSAALESGARQLAPAAAQTLTETRDRFASLGAAPLADALSAVLQSRNSTSANLLRAAYRLLLFRQSLKLGRLQ